MSSLKLLAVSERSVEVISVSAGVVAGWVGYFGCRFINPLIHSLSIYLPDGYEQPVTKVAKYAVSILCSCLTYHYTRHCLSHFVHLASGDEDHQKIYHQKLPSLIKIFQDRLYQQDKVANALKRMKVSHLQALIADYLGNIYQKYTYLRQADEDQQLEAIQLQLDYDLIMMSQNNNQKGEESPIFDNLISQVSLRLESIRTKEKVAAAFMEAYLHLKENDVEFNRAFTALFGNLSSTSPAVIRHLAEQIEDPDLFDQQAKLATMIKTHPLVKTTLKDAVINHIKAKMAKARKIEQRQKEKQEQKRTQQPLLQSQPPGTLSPPQEPTEPKPVKKKRSKKDIKVDETELATPTPLQPSQPRPFIEQDKDMENRILATTTEAERKQHLKKCFERINDCVYWDSIALVSTAGDGWEARDKNGNIRQIYHMSAGFKDKGERNKATLLFTRSGNKVEPIAIAAHLDRSTIEYKIINCLGGWQLNTKTVDLTQSLVATGPTLESPPDI
ncbi:hypothetical protein M3P05_08270 [Sansalvadorimonas sp. 2012CJ34-2]|uniref:Uncharacterized protein n=1 Tax=Parendozoicomonas callyspongiae TaxID=2942213 RepID=A0ABT0PF87_9GAMM|nr:hypothetical protein [Sansalvadorimonas sp. 2012CJ34-2]MCL6269931.1 hypothetical protein [Sansalvadorimonas sp. 2012CJ34-2]